MIIIHELGHFFTAKASGVKVLEFTIGFGPAIFKKTYNDTVYALRIIPFGGAVVMAGEDEDNYEDGSFQKAAVWQRFIIIAAGAVMNLLLGFVILFFLNLSTENYSTSQIAGFISENTQIEQIGIQKGDIISKVNGYKILLPSDVEMGFLLNQSDSFHDIEVKRNGEKILFKDAFIEKQEYTVNGQTGKFYGFLFEIKPANFLDKIRITAYNAYDYVRMIGVSIRMLFSGQASMNDMSGPVAITAEISNAAKQSVEDAFYFIAFISINLGIMNLLPLPALDGGRLVFIIIEALRGKPVNPKYEGLVHAVGLVLFLGLFLFVTFNDILKLIV